MLMKFQTAVENDGYVSSFFLEHRASVEYLLTRQNSRRLLKAILDLKDSHWVNERTDFTLKNRRLNTELFLKWPEVSGSDFC